MISKIKKIFDPVSYYRLFQYIKKYGFKGIRGKFKSAWREGDPRYIKEQYTLWFEKKHVTEEELERQRKHVFDYLPKISILVPTYNTPSEYLQKMIDSVREQSYSNWELCIADGSTDNETRKILGKYASMDERVKINYLTENYGISGNTNKAFEIATGDFIGLLDHDDYIEPDLLFEVVSALQDRKVSAVYTDEDKVVNDKDPKEWRPTDPNFKPDFSIDLFTSHNYITHFFAVRKSIVDKVGAFNSEFDGAQDYEIMFRCIEDILAKNEKIYHVAKPLYHWRMHANSTAENPESKMYCYEAGRRAISEHFERIGVKATVEITELWGLYRTHYETEGNPLVSIIIPNKDHSRDLNKCIKSIEEKSIYKNVEFIIVENNSEDKETFENYKRLEEKYDNIKVVYYEGEFNYSAINNLGAKNAAGEYLLLLNNDTELISEDGIKDMLGICMRSDVGIVGAKLLYDDNTVQHAGIVLGFGGFAGHVFHGIGENDYGFMMRPRINCNYSAVTAACLMVKKSIYDEVGGLTEEFKVGLNDVDFCLKVREKDYLIVYDAFAKWYHYESKSRGYEDTPEKKKRFEGEIALFQKRWGHVLEAGDPFYNKNFPVTVAPFTLKID